MNADSVSLGEGNSTGVCMGVLEAVSLPWECYNENGTLKKRKIAHPQVFCSAESAPFVPALGLQRTRSFPIPLRPQDSVNRGPRQKHHITVNAKSRDIFDTGDFAAT